METARGESTLIFSEYKNELSSFVTGNAPNNLSFSVSLTEGLNSNPPESHQMNGTGGSTNSLNDSSPELNTTEGPGSDLPGKVQLDIDAQAQNIFTMF